MKRTYLDSSVLIQAVQGVDGDKTMELLEWTPSTWRQRSG